MSEPRLRELRLVGFKSFAEATRLEFGPGISAVVGPNGSGKSNLADALRWALGEQGRSLRTRKSEDVIFAGSARRHATGMADVSLVIDNDDRLLPVEYGLVECGRRLYRSGENEYLLNRQKVRLRDLVDLLDAANLADNAFLFIGQGMVDQALSLRPEERRPLFEEAAGVRRHERRRRQAEERLVEAEANLARVHDILGELRPQARRLASQAEQQVARRDAAAELAEALVVSGRGRWSVAAAAADRAADQLAEARTETDAALRALSTAEDRVAAIARGLNEGSEAIRVARTTADTAREAETEARLAIERLTEALAGVERDDRRAAEERRDAEGRILAARRVLALPAPEHDRATQVALDSCDAALAAATAELAKAESAARVEDEREASIRRARQVREAERGDLQRRAAEAHRRHEAARQSRAAAAAAEAEAAAAHRAIGEGLEAALADVSAAATVEADATARAATAEARRAGTQARANTASERSERLRERLAAVDDLLLATERGGLLRAATRRGGRRLAEGLEVEPDRLPAVEAALGDLLRAPIVAPEVALDLHAERGLLVLDGTGPTGRGGRADSATERLLRSVAEVGGGHLAAAIRRDPGGHVERLLAAVAWVPTLEAALALRAELPAGWRLVTERGEVITAEGVVRLGAPDAILERRAEREQLAAELAKAEVDAEATAATAAAADGERATAEADLALARERLEAARVTHRRLEEQERAAARLVEATAREAAWEAAQEARLASEADRAAADVSAMDAAPVPTETIRQGGPRPSSAAETETTVGSEAAAIAAWQHRVAELRARREALAASWEAGEIERRAVEDARRRAEVAIAMDEDRVVALERAAATRAEAAQRARDELAATIARREAAREAAAGSLAVLAELEARERDERQGLVALETDVLGHRERLRRADERARAAELAEVEARLALDAAREALLVELAALGPAGLAALGAGAQVRSGATRIERPGSAPLDDLGGAGPDASIDESSLALALEAALDEAVAGWVASPEAPVEAPGPVRLGLLRRRYHELGASNPFAAEEYAEVRERLAGLEAQEADLSQAIAATRALIEELGSRITEQFLATFAALEGAFARRFEQLFDGGAASLMLTEPEALTQTGVEIMARPPGKKRQPLSMLSGGERALTAVALLFAMLEVRPVPFCVLDEVDAALDEANVIRFAGALRELAETTQFVVITHNRGTIEAADALYGVTLGDDAVSRVISLRLAEATELVAAGG